MSAVKRHFQTITQQPKYAKYADAPIYIVYSSGQDQQSATGLNDGLSEEKVLENFALKKNGLIIVVDKLQTGFDERRLHTLFLHKEIRGIAAIQAISRVDRTAKYKNDCKIVDFSYNNVNVQNIKDAFDHFSDVVVSDFDPFSDRRVLEILFSELKKSGVYTQFFDAFLKIFNYTTLMMLKTRSRSTLTTKLVSWKLSYKKPNPRKSGKLKLQPLVVLIESTNLTS